MRNAATVSIEYYNLPCRNNSRSTRTWQSLLQNYFPILSFWFSSPWRGWKRRPSDPPQGPAPVARGASAGWFPWATTCSTAPPASPLLTEKRSIGREGAASVMKEFLLLFLLIYFTEQLSSSFNSSPAIPVTYCNLLWCNHIVIIMNNVYSFLGKLISDHWLHILQCEKEYLTSKLPFIV